MTKHNIDFKKARQFLKNPPLGCFSEYSTAYAITNENLRFVTELSDLSSARVLTAAGSGDHPIFYALAGAAHIDTFDISFCAKTIMDIKTTAISAFKSFWYFGLVHELYDEKHVCKLARILQIKNDLPDDTREFIEKTNGCRLFAKGCFPFQYKSYLPTIEEYKIIQERIRGPFNFVWTDICKLRDNLEPDSKYDVINISNIFHYRKDAKTTAKIMNGLEYHLAPGGQIISYNSCPRVPNREDWKIIQYKTLEKDKVFVLQKIR